jgi:hypothetical protein
MTFSPGGPGRRPPLPWAGRRLLAQRLSNAINATKGVRFAICPRGRVAVGGAQIARVAGPPRRGSDPRRCAGLWRLPQEPSGYYRHSVDRVYLGGFMPPREPTSAPERCVSSRQAIFEAQM